MHPAWTVEAMVGHHVAGLVAAPVVDTGTTETREDPSTAAAAVAPDAISVAGECACAALTKLRAVLEN